MADEKVNASPEESKIPEAPAPSGPGDPPALEHTDGPAVPGGDQAAPSHAEPAAGEHTQQTVLPGMGEDAPASSGKVINLSDIQAADKGGKEASAPAQDKKTPEADKPPKRRGRPPKEQAGPTVEKKAKAAEPRTGRPSKVDKAAREEAPPSVRDKVGLLTKCHIIMGWQNKWEEKRHPMASICVPYQSFEVQGRGGKEAVVLRCLSSPPQKLC